MAEKEVEGENVHPSDILQRSFLSAQIPRETSDFSQV